MKGNIFYWTPPRLDVVISTSHKTSMYDRSFDVAVYDVLAKGEWPKHMDTDAMRKEIKNAIAPIVAKYMKEPKP